jgi:hypothetical protein
MLVQYNVLEYLIIRGPGRTERDLSKAIHGLGSPQQAVNQDCRMLVLANKVERRGQGVPGDPYRYYPKAA